MCSNASGIFVYLYISVIHLLSTVKISCVTVSTQPVKAVIEDHIQVLIDTLFQTVRRSADKQMVEIDAFVAPAVKALGVRPQTSEEIGEATKMQMKFFAEKAKVLTMFLLQWLVKHLEIVEVKDVRRKPHE